MSKREQMPDTTGCDHDWQPAEGVPDRIRHFNFEQCTKCGHVRSDLTPFPPLKLNETERQYAVLVAACIDQKAKVSALETTNAELTAEVERLKRDRHHWKRENADTMRCYHARGEYVATLASHIERLWVCLKKLMIYVPIPRGQRRAGSGSVQIDSDNAIKSRDLDALCGALGVK